MNNIKGINEFLDRCENQIGNIEFIPTDQARGIITDLESDLIHWERVANSTPTADWYRINQAKTAIRETKTELGKTL